MFIKICGLTDPAAVTAAVEAGADAIGFVFADSVREIAPAKARALCEQVPEQVIRVAVMHHPSRDRVNAVLNDFGPDWVQTDAEDLADIELPAGTTALPVYREGRTGAASALPERLLFEGGISGSGTTADWNEARQLAGSKQLILAGGLDAGNVVNAIEQVRPFGVDVSSGVEAERGKKDIGKIREFVARVRALES